MVLSLNTLNYFLNWDIASILFIVNSILSYSLADFVTVYGGLNSIDVSTGK